MRQLHIDLKQSQDQMEKFYSEVFHNHSSRLTIVESSVDDIKRHIRQIATTVNELKAQSSNRLPSQPLKNPRETVQAIYTKSGKLISDKPPHYDHNLKNEHLGKEPQFLPLSVKTRS